MTRRSEPKPGCPYCRGAGFVMVTRDPDTDVDCVCTDPPLSAEERVTIIERRLGLTLLPWQREIAIRALDGESKVTKRARRSGWKTIRRVVMEASHV
ncbi:MULTISPECIES: hypothetical protein [unclassified Microbacterium]|uniref:hypothetical protein n=1 Tax=unclassified Microbacterium TaxID=2609290 RepID=UPI00300FEEC3